MSECRTCGDGPCFPGETYCSKACEVESDLALGRTGQEIKAALPDGFIDDADVSDGWSTKPPPPFHRSVLLAGSLQRALGVRPVNRNTQHVLSTDSEERKATPIFSGVLNYFPLAMAALARHSKRGNDKHNPGEPLHWARGKSMDHPDCIARHLIDYQTVDLESGEYLEAVSMLWRSAALVEELEEKRLGKPMSRGSKESGQ